MPFSVDCVQEFVCFVGDKSENLDVDISAFLFDAKVSKKGEGGKGGKPNSCAGDGVRIRENHLLAYAQTFFMCGSGHGQK